jgi:hypothetical protein
LPTNAEILRRETIESILSEEDREYPLIKRRMTDILFLRIVLGDFAYSSEEAHAPTRSRSVSASADGHPNQHDIRYWTEVLGVTKDRLQHAVDEVGNSVDKVRAFLRD